MSKKFNHSEYEDDEDDDFDFEEITKAAAKKKRKRANEPQSKESKSSLSRSSTVGQEKVSTTIEIDQELSAKERARIILQAGVINKNSPSSPMRIPFRDDEVTVAAKSLMESLMNKRNRLTSKAAAVSNSGTTPHDVIDQFTLPVLRTSEQHRKLLEGQGVGIPSSMIDNGFVDEKVDKVRLKTRLNGKHEKIWTMNTRDPLSKVRNIAARRIIGDLGENNFLMLI